MRRTLTCLLAAGVLSLLAACGTSAEDPDTELITATIPTADGEIAVTLDAHGQQTDTPITIEAITPAQGDQPSEDFVAAFRLLPAGATFDVPIALRITLVGAPEPALAGLHTSGDAPAELIEFLPLTYDASTGRTTYEGTVTHFSEVALQSWGEEVETRILPDIPGDTYLVGDSFTMRVRTIPRSLPSRDGSLNEGRQVRVTSAPGPLNFTASWASAGSPIGIDFNDVVTFKFITREEEFHGSPLTPTTIDARPREQQVTDGQALTFEQEFTCVSPGRFFVWFRGNLKQPGELTTFAGADVVHRATTQRWAYARVAITGECVAPAGTATPAPGAALPTTGVASPTAGVAPTGTALTTGPGAIPTVVLPPEIGIATPASGPGTGELPGFIRVYAYAGVFYYADSLVVTPAHEPFCSYEHLHGGPIPAVERDGLTLPPIAEMYGECGFGPTTALFWFPEPE